MGFLKRVDIFPVIIFSLGCIVLYFSDFSLAAKGQFFVFIVLLVLNMMFDLIANTLKLSTKVAERVKIGLAIALIISGVSTLGLIILDSL